MTTPPAKPNRYELPITSMVGAMLVVLVGIGGFVAFRGSVRDNKATPIPVVDYQPYVQAGREEKAIATFAPTALPAGARATSATYVPGPAAHWHLGVLTADGKYIGLEESLEPVAQQVSQYISGDAQPDAGPPVTINGVTWTRYSDNHGDVGLARTLPTPDGRFTETLVVGGTASVDAVTAFAASLAS